MNPRLGLDIQDLPVRQHTGEEVEGLFALSADDGSYLTDDDETVMETYGDGNAA